MSNSTHGLTITSDVTGNEQEPDVVIAVGGDFDAHQVDAFEQATRGIPDKASTVMVDLSACTILDSAALGSLVRLKLRLEAAGTSFSIAADKPFQRQILSNTRLGEYLGLRELD